MATTVKTVDIQLHAQTEEAQKKLDRIVADTEELKRLNPEVKVRLDRQAVTRGLAVLRAEVNAAVDSMSQDVAIKIGLRDRLLARFLGGRNGGGFTGFVGGLIRGGGSGSGGVAGSAGQSAGAAGSAAAAAAGSPAGAALGLTAAAAGIASLLGGAGGLIPDLVAASAGVLSFGALAVPTILKITAALSGTKGALKALDPGQLGIVRGIKGLETEFGKMAKILEPVVTKLLGVGVKIAQNLLPALLPFAQVAGKVLLQLANGVEKFTRSPGFANFVSQLLKLSGPALAAIGESIGKIAIGIGNLILSLENPNDIKIITLLGRSIGGTLNLVARVITWLTPRLVETWGRFAAAFRNIIHWTYLAYQAVVHTIGNVGHAAGNFGRFWAGTWDLAGRIVLDTVNGIGHAIGDIVSFFAKLPGRVTGALLGLSPALYRIGASIISGLLHGIESGVGSILSTISNLAGSITSTLAGLLGIHSPSTVLFEMGRNAGLGLAGGLASTMPHISAAAAGAAGALIPGYGYGTAYSPALVTSRGAGRGGWGGNHYAITVNVPPSANKRQIGGEIVECIRQFEIGTGKGWRS